jgi:hypothetical protein
VKVFDRSKHEDQLIATGGYGASRDQSLSDHCFEVAEGGERRRKNVNSSAAKFV